ncbi:unnamed protein product, partial [marine sediment metagenome]
IWEQFTSETVNQYTHHFIKTDSMHADITHMPSGQDFLVHKIISLDADGFTVDDDGSDQDPNANLVVYCYVAIG